jgi:chromosomal replication initiator protein
VTTEAFTDGFIRSLHSGSIEKFKERYRNADVLLVDDVQFFESKAKTEAEFFHTFNALYETGAQLVLTSDRMPRDLEALEARLRERFESGLVTDVERPDYATRLTILRMRAKQAGVEFDDRRGLDVIAARIDSNVRALEGALIRVVAFHSMHANRPLDGDLAREVLDTLYPPGRAAHTARTSVRAIQDATAARFAISRDELLSASRAARLALPRQVAMYLARELTDEPLATIGRAFGDRTHSTVLHACQATAARMTRDPETFDAVRELTDTLRGASADRVP